MFKKFNWGHGIILFFAVYCSGIIYAACLCIGETHELVNDNYYNDEIKYQQVIDQKNNAASLVSPVQFRYNSGQLLVIFPKDMNKVSDLQVRFYKPDQEKLDKVIKVSDTTNDVKEIDVSSLKAGYWKTQTTWKFQSKKYLEDFVFNK